MENDIETYKKDLEFKENKLKEAKESIQENENSKKFDFFEKFLKYSD